MAVSKVRRFDHDVVIVGGGPAGISTWLHLRQRHRALAARTVVVEKAVFPRDKPCGGGLTPAGDQTLRALGIHLDVPSVPIHEMRLRFGRREHRVRQRNLFRVVRRRELDHALAAAAVERGLELRQGETFRGFERLDGGLRVETSRGGLTARVLVGADGGRSVVRRRAEIDSEHRVAAAIEVVTPAAEGPDSDFERGVATFDFTAVVQGLQGYAWDFPCHRTRGAGMNRGIFDSRLRREAPPPDLRAIFRRQLQSRGADAEPRSWQGHPEHLFAAGNRLSRPHVVLVGDAAGVEPTFGEGIAPALRYGDVAARALVGAFRRRDFSFATYRERLLEHPLGEWLRSRASMAQAIYGDGASVDELYELFQLWLLVAGPAGDLPDSTAL